MDCRSPGLGCEEKLALGEALSHVRMWLSPGRTPVAENPSPSPGPVGVTCGVGWWAGPSYCPTPQCQDSQPHQGLTRHSQDAARRPMPSPADQQWLHVATGAKTWSPGM